MLEVKSIYHFKICKKNSNNEISKKINNKTIYRFVGKPLLNSWLGNVVDKNVKCHLIPGR